MKKSIFLFIFLVGGVLFSFSSFAQNETEDFSGQSFEGFNLVGYGDQGEKKWDLKGDTAQVEDGEINIKNVDANSYGQEDMNVTANTGKVNKANGDMRLQGDVVVTTETGTKMLTDSLDWQKEEDLITTKDNVTILRENMKATGTGATARPNLNSAQLNENVTVEYDRRAQDPTGDVITVSCDGPLEVDYDKQTAVFNDNVVAISEDRKLTADQMQLFFNQETKKIKELICLGNVVIIQGENISYSDKAVYRAEEKKIILSGRPRLQMYMNQDGKKDDNVPFGN